MNKIPDFGVLNLLNFKLSTMKLFPRACSSGLRAKPGQWDISRGQPAEKNRHKARVPAYPRRIMLADPVPLPVGPFDVLVIDPPWSHYGSQDKWGAAAKFYPCMSDESLLALPVRPLLKRSSVVFCWATCPRLDFAIRLLEAWGLTYRGVAFVWVKSSKATGLPIGARGVRPSIVKPTTELVLAASLTTKGRPMPLASEAVSQVVLAPTGAHSEKPVEVMNRIETLYPDAACLEMFARRERDGWTSWGNEVQAA